jgi:hypothetical protein
MRSANINVVRYNNGTLVKVAASAHNFMSFDFNAGDSSGTYVPSVITITPTFSGNITFASWQYSSDSGVTWNTITSGSHGMTIDDTTHVLSISSTCDVYSSSVTEIVFKCVGSDSTYFDTVTISRMIDSTYTFTSSYTDIKELSDKISIIASTDELQEFKNAGSTITTKVNTLDYTADGILLNILQAKAVIDGVQFDLYDAATPYVSGNLVIRSGKIYQAVTSTTGHEPPNTTYWKDVTDTYNMEALRVSQNTIDATALGTQSIVASTLVDKWITGKSYLINDVVWNNGKLYQCTANHTSSSSNVPPNTSYWKDSLQGTIISQFANSISLNVNGSAGVTSINLADGVLNMQSTDIANIISATALNLSSGTINISGSTAVNISGGAVNVTGGSITASAGTIAINGTTAIDMTAGTLSLSGSSTLNMTGGTISLSGTTALNMTAGTIGITGGTVTIGTSSTGALIINSPYFTLSKNGTISASNGSFSGSITGSTLSTDTVTASTEYGGGNEVRRYYIDTDGFHASTTFSGSSYSGKIYFTSQSLSSVNYECGFIIDRGVHIYGSLLVDIGRIDTLWTSSIVDVGSAEIDGALTVGGDLKVTGSSKLYGTEVWGSLDVLGASTSTGRLIIKNSGVSPPSNTAKIAIQGSSAPSYDGATTAQIYYYDGSSGWAGLFGQHLNQLVWANSPTTYVQLQTSNGTYGITAWASDETLKKNIVLSQVDAISIIKSFNHYSFDWKDKDGHIDCGYIAQRMNEIDDRFTIGILQQDKSIRYQIDETTIVPIISKALKDSIIKIEKLEADIEYLKTKVQ